MSTILELQNIGFHYDAEKVNVFTGLNYSFETGKIYAVVGKSGAGKTTLLSLIAGLAEPTSGDILLSGKSIKNINKYEMRSKLIGVVFQSYNLLPQLSAAENVELSMDISGKHYPQKKRERAMELLTKVGLDEDEANRRVLKLSGGQQQRVAIARTLSFDPDIILADEPTGNLDGETQKDVMKIFRMLADEGKCVIIVTHSPTVAELADITYELTCQKKVK